MINPPDKIQVILPHGEAFRIFMTQSFITDGDLKTILRQRGVFLHRTDKQESVPHLISTLLAPSEFDRLRSHQETREDTPKKLSRFKKWNSDKTLIEALPSTLNVGALIGDHANYTLIGDPTFVPVDRNPNHVRMEYEIERVDLSKSWMHTKNTYKGAIEFQKITEGKKVKLVVTHTAAETKQLGQKISLSVTKHLNEAKHTDGDFQKILFSDFSNEQRIGFLWSLTGDTKTDSLTFVDIVDVDVCPDPELPLPNNLKWMEAKVKNLKLQGKTLHETFFIKDKDCHKHLLFHRIEAKFTFDHKGATGNCAVTFEFAGFSEDSKNCEFQSKISNLSLGPDYKHLNAANISEQLLEKIEAFTLQAYEKIFPPVAS